MSGRGWAYSGLIVGAGLSVTANVAHSWIRPPAAAASWHPQPLAVVFSASWPLLAVWAIEILVKTPWPTASPWWWSLRYAGLCLVAGVAAFVSYRHLSALLASWGEDPITSHLGPLAIDGLMLMATSALLATRPALNPQQSEDPIMTRLAEAIRSGALPARPSAEAIRRHLHIAPTTARALRDRLRPAPAAPEQS